MLEKYAQIYYRDLTESVVPFWLRHSLDRECGGYFTGLDRDGSIYDPRKYMWLQGRAVWMFCRLYNEFQRREEYLDAATLGIDFIRRYGKDSQGRCYFSLTRAGKSFFYQRKPYSAVFFMMALLEYHKATGDAVYLEKSIDLYRRIVQWTQDPTLLGRSLLEGQELTSSLTDVMVQASMLVELLAVRDDPEFRKLADEVIPNILRHIEPTEGILIENVSLNGSDFGQLPEGRLFNPGHSIECAWFLLHLLRIHPNPKYLRTTLDVLERSLVFGWDREFGGIYYFMDYQSKPPLQLEAPMKLWWPHTEAIYALVLAYVTTGEDRWLDWLEKVHDYAFSRFVDSEYGEWYGYLDRRGNLTHTCKGGAYKGFFHVPRFLLMSVQEIENASDRGGTDA